jgi:hypothetical protein
MRSAGAVGWVGLILFLLAGCGRPPLPPEERYFPLQEGMRWTYRVTTEVAGRRETRHFTEVNAGTELLDGIPHAVRLTGEGTRYYLRATEDGIYRAAKQTVVELEPHKDTDPHWVLKHPPQPGTGWNSLTHPYVLRRISPYEETLSRGSALKMAYQITALDAVAEVPAGRFDHCLLVEGEAQMSLYADGREGYKEILINTREWYAPGVGLVKLEREEPMEGGVFVGGRMLFELEELVR